MTWLVYTWIYDMLRSDVHNDSFVIVPHVVPDEHDSCIHEYVKCHFFVSETTHSPVCLKLCQDEHDLFIHEYVMCSFFVSETTHSPVCLTLCQDEHDSFIHEYVMCRFFVSETTHSSVYLEVCQTSLYLLHNKRVISFLMSHYESVISFFSFYLVHWAVVHMGWLLSVGSFKL